MERGDAGSDTGFINYTPTLYIMTMFGLLIGLLGFWRVATLNANDSGTHTGVTSNSTIVGEGAQHTNLSYLASSVNNSGEQAGITRDYNALGGDNRSAKGVMSGRQVVDLPIFGEVDLTVFGQSQHRWEQFYAGPPDCGNQTSIDANCRE